MGSWDLLPPEALGTLRRRDVPRRSLFMSFGSPHDTAQTNRLFLPAHRLARFPASASREESSAFVTSSNPQVNKLFSTKVVTN